MEEPSQVLGEPLVMGKERLRREGTMGYTVKWHGQADEHFFRFADATPHSSLSYPLPL